MRGREKRREEGYGGEARTEGMKRRREEEGRGEMRLCRKKSVGRGRIGWERRGRRRKERKKKKSR